MSTNDPLLINWIAGERADGVTWREIKKQFFDACREVVESGIGEPITPQRIDDSAIEDSWLPLLDWMIRHARDLDPADNHDQHLARQRLNRARAKSRTDVHSSVRQ